MPDPKEGTGKKPKNSGRRLYTDEDATNSVPIKFSNINDVKQTIRKLESLYKSGKRPHKRISQIAQVLEQRSRFMQGKKKENALAKKYTTFLKERTKQKLDQRKKMVFKF